jgi:hypothetical protein
LKAPDEIKHSSQSGLRQLLWKVLYLSPVFAEILSEQKAHFPVMVVMAEAGFGELFLNGVEPWTVE